jgi:prepilin-type N-terminal cleavage/methylation domain-containing protein
LKISTKKQNGFTLVELVVVVAVVGVLAIVATPKIIGVVSDARTASLVGVAGELSTSSSVNYTQRTSTSDKGISITKCSDISGTLEGEALPVGYSFGGTIPSILDDDGAVITAAITSEGSTVVAANEDIICTIMTNTSPSLVTSFRLKGAI